MSDEQLKQYCLKLFGATVANELAEKLPNQASAKSLHQRLTGRPDEVVRKASRHRVRANQERRAEIQAMYDKDRAINDLKVGEARKRVREELTRDSIMGKNPWGD